jgi:chromosome segregation ATPase
MESTNSGLTRDLAVEQATVKSLKLQLKRLQKSSSSDTNIESDTQKLSEELRVEKAKSDESQKQIAALEGQIKQLRENSSGQARQALARAKESTSQIADMTKRLRELRDENASLSEELAKERAKSEQQIAALDAEIGQPRQSPHATKTVGDNAGLSEELAKERERADAYEKQTAALEEQIKQMRESSSGQARQALARAKQSTTQITEMTRTLREAREENARLKEEVEKSSGQDELTRVVAQLEAELAKAQFGSELQRQRIESLVAKNRELEMTVADLNFNAFSQFRVEGIARL